MTISYIDIDDLIADPYAPEHWATEAGWLEFLGMTLSGVLDALERGAHLVFPGELPSEGDCLVFRAEDLAYYLAEGGLYSPARSSDGRPLGYAELLPACREWYKSRRALLFGALVEELARR